MSKNSRIPGAEILLFQSEKVFNLKNLSSSFSVRGSKYTGRCWLCFHRKYIYKIDFERGNRKQYLATRRLLYRLRDNIIKASSFLDSFGFEYSVNLEFYK